MIVQNLNQFKLQPHPLISLKQGETGFGGHSWAQSVALDQTAHHSLSLSDVWMVYISNLSLQWKSKKKSCPIDSICKPENLSIKRPVFLNYVPYVV